ncbi:MAG: IMP cyclohydrolase [Patescibacteria group bacterium]
MDLTKLKEEAANNLAALKANPYPGRLIIAGLDETGKYLIQVYALMGRSPKSRNRVLVPIKELGQLKVEVADPSLLSENEDLSLIVYTAMAQDQSLRPSSFVVTNGEHTGFVLDSGIRCINDQYYYEPDAPNFTPRIAARFDLFDDDPDMEYNRIASMALLKKPAYGSEESDLYYYDLVTIPAFGYCIHTYSGDGNPLPSFKGDPYLLPLEGTIGEIAKTVWDNLDEANRISVAVKFIEIATGESEICVINKFQKA